MRRHITAITIITTAIVILTAACSGGGKKRSSFDPAKINFEVTYNNSLDNTLYPSFILGMANYNGKTESELFTIGVTSPKRNSVVRIVLES